MTAATSNPETPATARWSVLITGPTDAGKTRELGRHLARASEAGAETWAAARRPADRDVLTGLAGISRMADTAADTAAMISDASEEMSRRYGLIESGDASAGDFTWLVIAVDDYPCIGDSALRWDSTAGEQAETIAAGCRRPMTQLLMLGETVRIGVALTARSKSFLVPETRDVRIRHVTLPAPSQRGSARRTRAWLLPGIRRRPGKTVLPAFQAAGFLGLVRAALEFDRAHLTGADGAPARGYAFAPCIGTVRAGSQGDRVYLYPLAAYEAARSVSALLDMPFAPAFPQIDASMRDSGLIQCEISPAGYRLSVLRRVAGGTFRVWDLPADALLGASTGEAG